MLAMREHLAAMRDLLRRYGAIFSHAWQSRRETAGKNYLDYEAQFLPAALALQEAPASPAPRVTMWLLMAIALLGLLWSVFGRIDIVASTQGKIIASGRTKVVQPIETATIAAIHIADGQSVKAGDVLITLDATAATADRTRVADELVAAKLQAARARGLLEALRTGKPARISALHGVDAEKREEAQRLLEGQYAEAASKLERIDADVAKREAELQSTRLQVRKLEQTAPMARQRAQDFKDLAEENFVPRHRYLEREQVRIEQEADLGVLRSRLKEIEAALLEARREKNAYLAETRRIALDTLNDAGQREAALAQELIKAESRAAVMQLTAPVDGTVQQLAVHTVGGVVTPAQPLMMIVPGNNPLEVDAFVENKDIGFVNAGQDAEVKIETFPYTKYGTIRARVMHVSHDAITDEKRGLVYAARLKLYSNAIAVENKTVNLTPGMAVTAEIKTGKRRVVEYFLSPLLQYKDESLRER